MSSESSTPRAAGIAFLGLGLAIAGPASHFLLLSVPWQRSSAAPAWGLMAVGCVLGAIALRRDRRWRARLPAAGALLLTVLFAAAFFGMFRLPAAPDAQRLERVPDFSLPDHQGAPVSLRDALASGPVLLVFYRGHW